MFFKLKKEIPVKKRNLILIEVYRRCCCFIIKREISGSETQVRRAQKRANRSYECGSDEKTGTSRSVPVDTGRDRRRGRGGWRDASWGEQRDGSVASSAWSRSTWHSTGSWRGGWGGKWRRGEWPAQAVRTGERCAEHHTTSAR